MSIQVAHGCARAQCSQTHRCLQTGLAIVLIVSPHTNVGGASRESFGLRLTSPVMPTVNDDDTADDDGHVPWLALPLDSTVAAPPAAAPACAAGAAAAAAAAGGGPK
jgi:hypothetical protein